MQLTADTCSPSAPVSIGSIGFIGCHWINNNYIYPMIQCSNGSIGCIGIHWIIASLSEAKRLGDRRMIDQ
jgi:hypothetical protein